MHSESGANRRVDTSILGLPLPLSGRTSLFAILGDPIAQAGSPIFFNTAFRKRNWPAVLVPMQVSAPELPASLQGLRTIANLRGLVLTTPHKTAALQWIDSVGPEGSLVRSINAIRCDTNGRWHGENFDGLGCVAGLTSAGHNLTGKRILIVGAGGAGRAIASAVAREAPAVLRLNDVDTARANSICACLELANVGLAIETGPPDPEGFDVAINCTPLGMKDRPGCAIDPARLGDGTLVVDLVVEPEMTSLLVAAKARGCVVQPGLRTLEGQVDALCSFFEGKDRG